VPPDARRQPPAGGDLRAAPVRKPGTSVMILKILTPKKIERKNGKFDLKIRHFYDKIEHKIGLQGKLRIPPPRK
jgi:hypothetical protein